VTTAVGAIVFVPPLIVMVVAARAGMARIGPLVAVVVAEPVEETADAGATTGGAAPVALEEVEEFVQHGINPPSGRPQKNPDRIQTDEPGSRQATVDLAAGAGADARTD
jgi:hypothetical protein